MANEPKKKARKFAGLEAVEREPIPEGFVILELYVENIMRVRTAHIVPKSNTVVLSGKNGSGKTSVINAITWALTGLASTTSQPISAGEKVGIIKLDVGEFTVTRFFTRVDPEKSAEGNTYFSTLKIAYKNNPTLEQKSPQALLNSFLGAISFDPLAFIRMDDKGQLATLRKLVTFDMDIDELDRIQKEDYDKRRLTGRDADNAKTRLAALTKPAADLPNQLIDTAGLTKQLEGAANHNSLIAAATTQKTSIEDKIRNAKDTADQLRADAAQFLQQAEAIDGMHLPIDQIALSGPSDSCNVTMMESEAAKIQIGTPLDTATISNQLTTAHETNRAIEAAQRYAAAAKEAKDLEDAWSEIDTRMSNRTAKRQAAIERAKMPIEHLGVGDGEVLYKGLPFRQASNAEQIRVSVALGMASNPKLRVLCIRDGSLLDDDSMALLTELAEKNYFQVWIERIDAGGQIAVVMEEGAASGPEVVQPAQFDSDPKDDAKNRGL